MTLCKMDEQTVDMMESLIWIWPERTIRKVFRRLLKVVESRGMRLEQNAPLYTTPESKRVIDETSIKYRDAIRSLAKR